MTARAAACCSPGECPRVLKYAVLLRAFPGRQHPDSSTEKVDATMSDTVTRGIRVIVKPRFIAEQSDPDAGHWLFAYHITIRHEGSETVQLLNRPWVITTGESPVEAWRGPGVVGSHRGLPPGEDEESKSDCTLPIQVSTV